MRNFLLTHKTIVIASLAFIALTALVVMVVLLLSPTTNTSTTPQQATNSTTPPDGQYEGPTGGSGQPTAQQLVLTGWDTKNSANKTLAAFINEDIQNSLVAAILRHYTSKRVTSDTIVSGTITTVVFEEKTISFTITVESSASYAVRFNIADNSVTIQASNGEPIAL